MKRNSLILAAAFALLFTVACRPRAAATITPPPTPELQPTPTLDPIVSAATATPLALDTVSPTAEIVDQSDPAQAAETEIQIIGADPINSGFNGTFIGTLVGDANSSAPATLTLTQNGNVVSGTISVGEGLLVDGGNCGQTAVPQGSMAANGQMDPANANQLNASSMISVQGLAIELTLTGDLSADGQNLTAQASIDLPLLCGRDPVIDGTFVRQ
ncbi:MAG: hypothetical protein R3C44_22240 [Chloroflexota bacterium]